MSGPHSRGASLPNTPPRPQRPTRWLRRPALRPVAIALLTLTLPMACGAPPVPSPSGAAPGRSTAAAQPGSPAVPTRRGEVVDDYHGTEVADPYRWLEEQASAETRTWTDAQNRVTETWLAGVGARERLRRRLTELWNFERYSPPARAGARWVYGFNNGLQNQSTLFKGDQPGGPGAVLLDPNSLSADGTVAIGSLSFSEDGSKLAWSLSRSGSDWQEFKVRDVATGADLDDHLQWAKFTSATWLKDGSGFFYARYPAPEANKTFEASNRGAVYCLHRLGTPQAEDRVVWADAAHPDRHPGGTLSDDGSFLVLTITSGTDARNRISVLDLQDLAAGKTQPRPVIGELEASYEFLGNDAGQAMFLTDRDAPRRRVIVLDIGDPKQEWKSLVPQSEDTLESARIVGEHLILVYLRDARHLVKICKLDGTDLKVARLPGLGSVSGFTGRRKDRRAFFTFESFTHPPGVFELVLADATVKSLHQPKVAFRPADFVSSQVAFQSKDGARIPMFLVHQRGLPLDGSSPTYLYGYGGFNISLLPRFAPQTIAWLELGGVFAQPSLRGGGEFGKAWHESGMLANKQKVFDDFLAAAEFLLRNDYTSKPRLAIGGRSNGGLLVGAAMTQRPDLFGAAIPEVGVLDMLRYHEFTIGHAWIPEYGSSADKAMFTVLRAYSPLHNVKPGVRYPPTLVMTGDHDDRVLPGHSYKFAAALQRAQGADAPILLRVDRAAGHGAGKPTAKRIAEAADRWAFLIRALGVEVD